MIDKRIEEFFANNPDAKECRMNIMGFNEILNLPTDRQIMEPLKGEEYLIRGVYGQVDGKLLIVDNTLEDGVLK